MKKKTIEQKLCDGLERHGYSEIESKTRKYRTFKNLKDDTKDYSFFVGKNGALRKGRTSTQSVSWTNGPFYKTLIG